MSGSFINRGRKEKEQIAKHDTIDMCMYDKKKQGPRPSFMAHLVSHRTIEQNNTLYRDGRGLGAMKKRPISLWCSNKTKQTKTEKRRLA